MLRLEYMYIVQITEEKCHTLENFNQKWNLYSKNRIAE